jgi:hypothetical protein
MTKRAVPKFIVRESPRGEASIGMEIVGGDALDMFARSRFLRFYLPQGTTYERAIEIAQFLNDHLKQVSET